MKDKRIALLALFCWLAGGPARAQNQRLIDSLQHAVATQTDTAKVWTLTKLAWEYRPYNEGKALALNREALALAVQAGHVEQQGFCWMAVGNVYSFHENESQALEAYRTAEPLLKRAAGPRAAVRLAQLYYNWGLVLHERLNDNAGAIGYLLKAVRAYEHLGQLNQQAKALNLVGGCLYQEQRVAEAVAYYRQAEAAARRGGDLQVQLFVMNDFYSTYLDLYNQQHRPADLQTALQNLERGVALIRAHPGEVAPQYLPTFLTNLAEGYAWKRDFGRARRALEESSALTVPLGVNALLAQNYSLLAGLEAEQQRATAAEAAAERARRHLPACSIYGQATVTQRLQQAYARLGRWPEAHAWLARNASLRDSLAARAQQQTVRRLTLQYEVEKKDLNIRALTQEARYERRLVGLTAGLALLLLAGAALLVRSSRLRRRVAEQQLLLADQHAVVAQQESLLARQRQQQLQQEVDYKHRELTTTTLNLERKNELLLALRKELEQVPETRQQLKPAFRLIDKNLQLDDDIDQFRLHFEGVHPSFFQRLSAQAPAPLSATELRYCAYLRMGLATKEIANLLNIEPHSVRVGKHRLKQKLGLGKEVDLEEFIKSF